MMRMAGLIEAIYIRRKTYFELDEVPYVCLDVEIATPTARGGQTLVRVKMRNLKTRAVFDRTFRAGEKLKEPDITQVDASYLYTDQSGSHFMDQETFETFALGQDMIGDALDFLVEGQIVQLMLHNGNPIGIQLPQQVALTVTSTEPALRATTARGNVGKPARLETGLELTRAAHS